MFRVFLLNNSLIVFDKSEKDFRVKYGNNFEQVSIIKNQDNIELATGKLLKQYRVQEVIMDCKLKKKCTWQVWDEETRINAAKKISNALKRYIKTREHRENLSKGCKHFKSFLGKRHTERTKARIRFMRLGRNNIAGLKWMHNPYTGEQRRGKELLPGMLWGRGPEAKDYAYAMIEARRIKRQAKNLENY